MNLEDTIYYGCAAWASIHQNRAAALNHLFCVIGNGYDWLDGELVEVCGGMLAKNGKPLSLRAAINKAFRERRERRELEQKHKRKEKRRERRVAQARKAGKLLPGDKVVLLEAVQDSDHPLDDTSGKAHAGLRGVVAKGRANRLGQMAVTVSARDMGVDGKSSLVLWLPVAKLCLAELAPLEIGDKIYLAEALTPSEWNRAVCATVPFVGLEGVVVDEQAPAGKTTVAVNSQHLDYVDKFKMRIFLPTGKLKRQKPSDWVGSIRSLLEKAVAAEKKMKETDPVRYAEICAKREADYKRQKKEWRETKRWDYRIPVDIAKRVKDTAFDGWYPVADNYSYMCIFPDNIKPDWLEAIIETCRLIIASPPAVRPGYQDEDGKRSAAQSKDTVQLAIHALSHALSVQQWREKHGWEAKLPKWLSRAKKAGV